MIYVELTREHDDGSTLIIGVELEYYRAIPTRCDCPGAAESVDVIGSDVPLTPLEEEEAKAMVIAEVREQEAAAAERRAEERAEADDRWHDARDERRAGR